MKTARATATATLPDLRGLGILALMHTMLEPPSDTSDTQDRPPQANDPTVLKGVRIRQDLVRAGMTPYGLRKFNTRYLPSIIQDDEFINGVIYGRVREGPGLLNFVDRMIVATNLRVISFNHKPGYNDITEYTYDVIGGVDSSTAWLFTAVSLSTKVGNTTIRFLNRRCADIFVDYVERRRLEDYEENMMETKVLAD